MFHTPAHKNPINPPAQLSFGAQKTLGDYIKTKLQGETLTKPAISFKPFYIHQMVDRNNNGHLHDNNHKSRGFSAFIQPAKEAHDVVVQIVHCHKHDEFCKKKAREYLALAPKQQINIRKLDEVLMDAYLDCFKDEFDAPAQSFDWVYKYCL